MTGHKETIVTVKSLLKIDEILEQEWFNTFKEIEDPFSQCLLLVALMTSEDLIPLKENNQLKRLVMLSSESEMQEIVSSFLHTKSLFVIRNKLRGRLGLPSYVEVKISPPSPSQASQNLNQHSIYCSPRAINQPQKLSNTKNSLKFHAT